MSNGNTEVTIECEEVFDVSTVTDFKPPIQQAMAEGKNIVLQAGSIERIDAAALQLLAALFRDAGHKGVNISWNNPSEPLKYAAKLTGLTKNLEL